MRYGPILALLFAIFASAFPAVNTQAQTVQTAQADQIDGNYTLTGTNPNGTRYRGTVVIHGDGTNYRFIWLISNGDTFTGTGILNGNTIVVDWGQKDPVIYTVGNGVLYGTWAAGRGTETLTRR
jgi:hypothetical protein